MKCLYCDKKIERFTFKQLFLKDDLLCADCREMLKAERKVRTIENLNIETFFDYDGLFKDLLIQYKECYDEALAPVFLYDLAEYLRFKYHGYQIAYVPSSKLKVEERGFNHLELMFKELGLKKIEGLRQIKDISQQNKGKEEKYEYG